MKHNGSGQRIRAARIAAGFSQEDLGDTLGVTRSSVSLWEKGRAWPVPQTLDNLANVLKVKPGYLTEGKGRAPKPTKMQGTRYRRKMMTRFQRLIETGRFDDLLKDYIIGQISTGAYDQMLAKLGYRKK